jgi:hypothetical protein
VRRHDVAGREQLRLRDVALDDDVPRLGTERRRISVGTDGHDEPEAEIPDPGQRLPKRVALIEERAEGQIDERPSRPAGDVDLDAVVGGAGERDGAKQLASPTWSPPGGCSDGG